MRALYLLPGFLLMSASHCVGQKVMLLGGYQYVGQEAFQGVPNAGINLLFPVGQHLAAGLLTTAGRARQVQSLYIWNFGGSRTVDVVHNHFVTTEVVLGYRTNFTDRLNLIVGPTLGVAAVGRREQSTSAKIMGGLWAGATYQKVLGGRFNLEGAVHPQLLSRGPMVEDGNSTFAGISLKALAVQAGISYNLRK